MNNKVSCKNCALANLCLPVSLDIKQIEALEHKIKRKKPIKRNQILFHEGHPATHLAIIRSGAFKSIVKHEDREQITNFYLAGEIIGFEGISSDHYIAETIALTDSFVCEISKQDLLNFSEQYPSLQKQLFRLMSQEISLATQAYFHATATEKLLHFLIQLGQRFKRRGLSDSQFELPMAKQDIANYLGIANETISRLFTTLQKQGAIEVNKRLITLKNID